MELTAITYKATLEIEGKKITATISQDSIGIFQIMSNSFRIDSSTPLSVWHIAEFLKVLCTEHGETITNSFSSVGIQFPYKTCTFKINDVANQSTTEVLQALAKELYFEPLVN